MQRVRLVETQSPVNPGDSGGPVVDDELQLVGVTDSYTAGERLVSQSIDVSEVRDFLKSAPAAGGTQDKRPAGLRLRGRWRLQAAGKGDPLPAGEWDFHSDGTFVVSDVGRHKAGRYAYLNDVLWLVCDERVALGSPDWSSQDRFSFQAGSTALTFERLKRASLSPRRAQ
jgi:hypothetical protein